MTATDHRADCDLRHDVRQLLIACLSATDTARRWQLLSVAPSLAMLKHVLEEPPRQPAQSEAGREDGR